MINRSLEAFSSFYLTAISFWNITRERSSKQKNNISNSNGISELQWRWLGRSRIVFTCLDKSRCYRLEDQVEGSMEVCRVPAGPADAAGESWESLVCACSHTQQVIGRSCWSGDLSMRTCRQTAPCIRLDQWCSLVYCSGWIINKLLF